MKKFMLRRILPAMLALSVMVSLMVVPASAVVTPGQALEYISNILAAKDTLTRVTDEVDNFLLGTYSQSYGFCWCAADAGTAEWHVTEEELYQAKDVVNSSWPGVSAEIITYKVQGLHAIQLKIAGMSNNRIILLADDAGSPLVWDENDGYGMTPEEREEYTSARWIPAQQVQLRSGFTVPVPLARLKELAAENGGTVYKSSITDDNGTADFYYVIKNGGRYILGDSGLRPYTYTDNRVANKPEERPTGSIWVVDENGELTQVETDDLPDNVGVDLGSLIGNLPTDSNVIFNGCTYDESTKTYYYHTDMPITIDNRQYYYFTYNYHINYTSVTYIGTTEEYDKHYEVYYTLPDGRSSADLTAEELEQLNLSIDVINYGRSADDVSLRSLYHFDGDTDDESYWNYCTDFTWNKGASLTYMDEGTFGGSLYLDETEHDFTLSLPSGLYADFTIQFRYYQSATAAPQTDSYIKLGSTTVMQFDGSNIKDGSGTTLSAMPVGSWNELAMIRDSGTLYYYLNGVKIGSTANAAVFDKVTFHFGSGQQTFKKLDELRVLNTTLQKGGASYTPTSVPHDTNLALVLPDTAIPVADEYWVLGLHSDAPISYDFTQSSAVNSSFYTTGGLTYEFLNSGMFIYTNSKGYLYTEVAGGSTVNIGSAPALVQQVSFSTGKEYAIQVSMVLGDGSIFDYRFLAYFSSSGTAITTLDGEYSNSYFYKPKSFPGGCFFFDGRYGRFHFVFDSAETHLVPAIEIYYEQVTSISDETKSSLAARTPVTAEYVTSITPMTPEDLATPTLAVRSDIPVTTWQIGGVRPSVPTKGQVWALVERQYITSLQIYNGRAWESCDGRIWSGSRWVPYSSYNVITLKDMSDIMDSSGTDHEYIYTESGFWDWLQRWLNEFKLGLFGRLDKLKGSGTDAGSASSSAIPDVPSGSGSYDFTDGSGEDVTLPEAAKDSAGGLWAFVKGVWKLVGGAFKNAGKAVSDLTDAADTANPDGAFGFFLIPLEEEGG